MMKHNVIETAMGAVVLAAAAIFLVFAMKTANIDSSEGYRVTASFTNANGLIPGTDVRIGGVKVGSVASLHLDTTTYNAEASIMIDDDVQLPADTSATIRSEGLMGGKFLALEPGGDEKMLTNGSRIQHTQSTPDIEQLLGQAIFSMSQSKAEPASTAAPAP